MLITRIAELEAPQPSSQGSELMISRENWRTKEDLIDLNSPPADQASKTSHGHHHLPTNLALDCGSGLRLWTPALDFGSGLRLWTSSLDFGSGLRLWTSTLDFGSGLLRVVRFERHDGWGSTTPRRSRPLERATLSREPPRGGSQHLTN